MEIRLNRQDFVNELVPMLGVVERKTTIPVLSHVLLTARQDKLHLAATDLDVSLTSSCAADVKEEGSLPVPAKKFIEIVRSMDGEEVLLRQEEPGWLSIQGGRSRFKIHALQVDDFPTLPEVGEGARFEVPFKTFKGMIGKVLFAISAEESRFQLNGALLKVKEGFVEMVATDGRRLALVEEAIETASGEDSVLVPRKALHELQRFEGGDTLALQRGEHHVVFRLGRRELICRILEGTFPDYERVIAKDNDKHVEFPVADLAAAVQRVAIVTGDRARTVQLSFDTDELIVQTQNPDLGDALEVLPCDYKDAAFRIGINPDYLRDFLSAVGSERVRLELKDENTQCVGFPVAETEGAEDGRYLCVIMPMRL
ncbi:MAG: DNA polymerase III subunit beta [Acidobacteriota bacterium]